MVVLACACYTALAFPSFEVAVCGAVKIFLISKPAVLIQAGFKTPHSFPSASYLSRYILFEKASTLIKFTMVNFICYQRLLLIVLTLFHVACATIQTQNLGQLSLLPGLAGRLFTSTLTGSETQSERDTYLKQKSYLNDGILLSQRIVTQFTSTRVKYLNNNIFGLYYPPDDHDLIIELRGYIKAPATGVPKVTTNLSARKDCNDEYAYQSATNSWAFSYNIFLNQTADGFLCSYNTSATLAKFPVQSEAEIEMYGGGISYLLNGAYLIEGQYYPIVMSTRVSGDAFFNDWRISINSQKYTFDEITYYDPNDDFVANDASDKSSFPNLCPQFHNETFEPKSFVTPTSIVSDKCPTSSVPPSLIRSSTAPSPILSSSPIPSSTSSTEYSNPAPSSSISAVESSTSTPSSLQSSILISSGESSISVVSSKEPRSTQFSTIVQTDAVSSVAESSLMKPSYAISRNGTFSSYPSNSISSGIVVSSSKIASSDGRASDFQNSFSSSSIDHNSMPSSFLSTAVSEDIYSSTVSEVLQSSKIDSSSSPISAEATSSSDYLPISKSKSLRTSSGITFSTLSLGDTFANSSSPTTDRPTSSISGFETASQSGKITFSSARSGDVRNEESRASSTTESKSGTEIFTSTTYYRSEKKSHGTNNQPPQTTYLNSVITPKGAVVTATSKAAKKSDAVTNLDTACPTHNFVETPSSGIIAHKSSRHSPIQETGDTMTITGKTPKRIASSTNASSSSKSGVLPFEASSTTLVVHPFSGECSFFEYKPALLIIAVLVSLL